MNAIVAALLATHTVFNFVDNRTLGHAHVRGGLGIAAGAPGFAKYDRFSRLLSGWTRGEKVDGKPVAWAAAQAVLEVPLRDKADAVWIRLKSNVKQSVKMDKSPAVPVAAGWQTVKVPVALHAGENELHLTFGAGGKKAAAIEWIQVGGSEPPADAAAPSVGDAKGLALPADFYVFVPKGAQIEGACEGGKLHVRVVPESGSAIEGDAPLAADLGKVARVELSGCAKATAAIALPGAAPEVKRAPPPKNVVLWLTDNTRADKIKAYNPKTHVETPTISALAKTSTVFRAYSTGNESRVSHASLWTSMYPLLHGMIPEKAKLPESFVTMAEALKPSGKWIAGISANGFIDKFWGFEQGWDQWKNPLHEGGGLSAGDVMKAGLGMLKPHAAKPFYFYIGTIDAHTSWRAHEPWLSKYDASNGAYSGPFVKACTDPQEEQIVLGKLKINDRDKSRIRAIYESDVSYNDQQLGLFLAELEKMGHSDDTMVIVTADHGEEFWERGKIGHGQSLHDELVWVPLLIHYPPLFPAKTVDGADLLDIVPTILDVWGLKLPADWQGESLLEAAQGGEYPRPSIAVQYELAHTMRLGHYKIWVSGTGQSQLYDLTADPGETKDAASAHPIARRWLTDSFGTFLGYYKQWKKSRWGTASNHKPALAADLEK